MNRNKNRNGHGGGEGSGVELLINTAEYFLRNRNLEGCRKYAVQAQESNPVAASQILAVVDVLAAASFDNNNNNNNNRPDWYSILGVKRYSEDLQLLRNQYKKLILLLNPNKNNSPFAPEAFDLVRHAWTLLSNPLKKNQFDNELRMFFGSQTQTKQPLAKMKKQKKTKTKTKSSSNSTPPPPPIGVDMEGGQCGSDSGGSGTFWTVCPYCYYVYEYVRVYEDCCLRCQNHTCMRAFHAVAIRSPPPPAVVRNGEYWCLGFNPIGFQSGGDRAKGFSSWMPFAPMFTATPHEEEEEEEEVVVVVEKKKKNSVPPQGGNQSNIGNNSDNSSDDELMGKTEENASGKKVQTEQVKGVESFDGCTRKTYNREVPSPSPSPSPSVAKPVMKRKKSVARNTKKIMGKGTRIKKDETIPEHVEGPDWDTDDAGKYYEDFGSGIAGGMEKMGSSMGQSGTGMDGLQFFDGEDDDIFVGLQDGFF